MNQAIQVALVVGVVIFVIYLLRNSSLGKLLGGVTGGLNKAFDGIWSGAKWVGGAFSSIFGDHRNKGTTTSEVCYATFCGCQAGDGYKACTAACDTAHGPAIKKCIAGSDARKDVPLGQTTVGKCYGKICGCTTKGKAFAICSAACDRDHGQEVTKCIATDNGRIPYAEVPVASFPPATTRQEQIATLARIASMLTALSRIPDPTAELVTTRADHLAGYAAEARSDMLKGGVVQDDRPRHRGDSLIDTLAVEPRHLPIQGSQRRHGIRGDDGAVPEGPPGDRRPRREPRGVNERDMDFLCCGCGFATTQNRRTSP